MAQRYEVTQYDKVYIISTIIINDKIRIECQDINVPSSPIYAREYTMNDLISLNNIFHYIPTIIEAQNELDNSIERKDIRILNLGDIIELLFTIQKNSYTQEVSFQLFPTQNIQKVNYATNILPSTTVAPIISVNNPGYNNIIGFQTYQTNEENDYPDCTYSTRNPNVYQNVYQTTTSYVNPLDQDRITKIELDENLVKNEHMRLIQRLNNLKGYIQAIKKKN